MKRRIFLIGALTLSAVYSGEGRCESVEPSDPLLGATFEDLESGQRLTFDASRPFYGLQRTGEDGYPAMAMTRVRYRREGLDILACLLQLDGFVNFRLSPDFQTITALFDHNPGTFKRVTPPDRGSQHR